MWGKVKKIWDKFKYLIIALLSFIFAYFIFRRDDNTAKEEANIEASRDKVNDIQKKIDLHNKTFEELQEEYRKQVEKFNSLIKGVKSHEPKKKDSDSAYNDIIDFINKPDSNSKE